MKQWILAAMTVVGVGLAATGVRTQETRPAQPAA
jgi:hypothetical protein